MSSKLRLSLACGDYEITRPLADGRVKPAGIELTVINPESRERHWRVARDHAYDICEFNTPAYFMGRDRGLPYVALPIYLHRRFRHGFLFVNANKGFREPKDLIGKRIGGTNYTPASNVWMRGILEENYGLPHRSVTWITERSEDIPFDAPPGLNIVMDTSKPLNDMLVDGDIPAMISPSVPRPFVEGDPRVARLFPDYKQIEIDFFKKTGIFPIMHVTTVKQEIVEKYPWVPINLTKALQESKQLAYRRVTNPRMVPLAWVRTALEEQWVTLGRDPWQYGLSSANRKNLETIQRYVHQQGMISKMRPLEELFEDTDLGDAAGSEEV